VGAKTEIASMYWKSLTPAVLAELKRSKATGQLATVDEPCDCLDEHGNTCSDCTCDHGVRHTLCSFNSLLRFHADALIAAAEEQDSLLPLQKFVDEHFKWANAQFPDETTIGKLQHLRKEVEELMADPHDLKEFADCGMLLFNALAYEGYSVRDLLSEMRSKFAEVR